MARSAFLAGALLLAAAAAGREEAAPPRGLRAEVAALLVQGVAGGSLPIAAALFPPPPEAGPGAEMGFLVEVPPAPAGPERPLEVYAYAVDPAGEVTGHFGLRLPVWPAGGEGVKVGGRLAAGPGERSLRLLAWDPTDRRYGLVVRRLAPGGSLSAPAIAEPCADWVKAGGPAELMGLSARPVLVGGERRPLLPGREPPPGGWRARFVGVGAAQAAGAALVAPAAAGPGELELEIPDVPPGVYRLSLEPAGGESASGDAGIGNARGGAPLEVWIVPELPPADGGCRRSWPRVLRHAREAHPDATAVKPPARVAERPDGDLESAYRAVLERLAAAADPPGAADRLAALEVGVAAEPGRLRSLLAAELRVAAELARRDPRCLVPLIALHAEAYRLHHRAGRFPLATHSRRAAAEIAELAVDRLAAGEPGERALVAVALTGLADMVETRRASIEAQRLLERVLELDGELEAARLLLAVSYERRGRYLDARRQLERLVAGNSAHHEARARLAILLRRLDDGAGAERLARGLVAERPPDWLLSLAYQTLGQVLIRDARLGEAAAVLAEAAERLPGDQAVRLLRAYALDRSGRRREVREGLAALPMAEAAASPRYRYSDAPAAALGLLRETLRQSVVVRLPVLALALEGAGGEGAAE